jgi:hypothetical protein
MPDPQVSPLPYHARSELENQRTYCHTVSYGPLHNICSVRCGGLPQGFWFNVSAQKLLQRALRSYGLLAPDPVDCSGETEYAHEG